MKSKDQQLLEEAYSSINQPINEGILGAIGSVFKPFIELNRMTKEVMARGTKFQTDLAALKNSGEGNQSEKNKVINQYLQEVTSIIDSADVDFDMSTAFETKLFSTIFRQLQQSLGGVSGDDVKRQLEIPDEIYRRLIKAAAQSPE